MKSAHASIIAGVVLIALGGLLLLDRMGVMDTAAVVAPLIFASVGVLFLSLFFRRRENWWAAIPGSVFLGLAAVIITTQLTGAAWGAAFLFLFMGTGFGAVFVREGSNWWSLIPAGVMLTLAVIVALPQELQGTPTAAVLFLGLATTFGVLSLVPVRTAGPAADRVQRMRWPLIPAAVLAVMGPDLCPPGHRGVHDPGLRLPGRDDPGRHRPHGLRLPRPPRRTAEGARPGTHGKLSTHPTARGPGVLPPAPSAPAAAPQPVPARSGAADRNDGGPETLQAGSRGKPC